MLLARYPLFFYKKYFFIGLVKKNSCFNYYRNGNYNLSTRKSLVLNFFSKKFQILTFLPLGFHTLYNFSVYSLTNNFNFVSLVFFLFNIFLGFSKFYKSKMYLVGLRVRIEKIYRKSIIMKLNLCHKVKWGCLQTKFFKFRKIKNAFLFKTRDFYLHNLFLFVFRRFKLPDIYKGNGIRFYKEKLKFKKRKQFGSF